MPTYSFKSPDGKTYDVQAPEGATQEQAFSVLQQHGGAVPVGGEPLGEQGNPEPRSFGQDLLRAAGMTTRAVVHGAGDVAGLAWNPIAAGVNRLEGAVGIDNQKYGLNDASQNVEYLLNKLHVPNGEPENGVERVVSGIDRGLGGLIGGVGVGGLLKAAATPAGAITGAGAPPAYGIAGIGDALTSNLGAQTAATAAGTGTSETAREAGFGPATQIGLGLAGGGAPAIYGASRQGITSLLGRLFAKPSAEAADLANTMQSAGIPLKASQVSPGRVAKLLDSVSGQVPFSGAQSFQNTQQQAFNRAVGRTIGVDAPAITSDVFANAKHGIGSEFERLSANNNLPLTPELIGKLSAVADDAKSFYGRDAGTAIDAALDRLFNQSQAGVLPGKVYQSLDSQLGKIASSGGEKSVPLGELRATLRDAMDAAIKPEDQSAWAQARKQWRDLKTLESLVAKDNVEGNISPAKLLGAVTANKAGKSAMATGTRGDLGDLAAAGQRFIKQQVPDSGTPQRLFAGKALGTVGSAGAGVLAGSTLGSLGGLATLGVPVAGSRAIQSILQDPALVRSLLGQKQGGDLGRLLMMSADPTAQQLIQR